MSKFYTLLLSALLYHVSFSQCMLKEISLNERIKESHFILEGKVTATQSLWDAEHQNIYTLSTIKLYKSFKGSLQTAEIILATPGGTVGEKTQYLEPSFTLHQGDEGVFLVKKLPDGIISFPGVIYETYAYSQGFVKKQAYSEEYNDIFHSYNSPGDLYSKITSITNEPFKEISKEPATIKQSANKALAPSITSFSPSEITAGTLSVLTINGTNFGRYTGSATVQFRNPDAGGSTAYYSSLPSSIYINSWTNTQIQVTVPGDYYISGAGTGLFKVIDSAGNVSTSPSAITVPYNQAEKYLTRQHFVNVSSGGYKLKLNTLFNLNTLAKTAFIRALNKWKCKTAINVTIDTATTALNCSVGFDNINVIGFNDPTCSNPLGAGVLGRASTIIGSCSSTPGKIYMESFDLFFSETTNWSFDTLPSVGLYDFESVALHELGHAFGEGHVLNAGEIMFPALGSNKRNATLNNASDVANVIDIMSRSVSGSVICSYTHHVLSSFSCNQSLSANFTGSAVTGCAPLTVQFTNTSTGIPTAYSWDIGNNGTIDFTSQNASYTFTTPGTYAVKLVVQDASKKDSVVKLNYIRVTSKPTVTVSSLQNVSCFSGTNGSLKAIPGSGTAPYTYTWTGTVQTTQTITNLSAGNYTVTVKDSNLCTVTSTVNTLIQPTALAVSFNTTPSSGSNGTAKANVTGGTPGYTYIWNTIPVQTTQTAVNLAPGNYSVTVKDINLCTKTSSALVGTATGINEIEKQFESLYVYPNPASNILNIKVELKQHKDIIFQLISIEGKILKEKILNNIRQNESYFELSDLATGTYVLKIATPEGNTFRKVDIQH